MFRKLITLWGGAFLLLAPCDVAYVAVAVRRHDAVDLLNHAVQSWCINTTYFFSAGRHALRMMTNAPNERPRLSLP